MSNTKTRRCKYFTNDGKPSGIGCVRGSGCWYAHPEDRQWAMLLPVHGPPLARAGGSGSFHSSHASASGMTGSNNEPLGSSTRNAWSSRPNNAPRTASGFSATWGPKPDWQGQATSDASTTAGRSSQPYISNLDAMGGASATSTSGWGSPQTGWGSPSAPEEPTSWDDIALARNRASGNASSGQNDSAASPHLPPAHPAQSPKASTSNTHPAATPSVRRTSGASAPWPPVVPTAAPQQAVSTSPTRSYTMGSPTRLYQLLYPEAGMLRAPARLSDDSMNVDAAPSPREPQDGALADWATYIRAIIKATTLAKSFDDATRRYQALAKVKESPRYQELESDFAAHCRMSTQLDKMHKEMQGLKEQYEASLRHLETLPVPTIPSQSDDTSDLEKKAEDLHTHILQIEEWLDDVQVHVEAFQTQAKAPQAAPSEDLSAKVGKLEDKMSELEEYAGELNTNCSTHDHLTEKLQDAQRKLRERIDEQKIENMKSDSQGTQNIITGASSLLATTRSDFRKFREEQSAAEHNMSYYKAKFEQLKNSQEEMHQAYQANSAEIARLRAVIDNLSVQQSSAPPIPQFTREDLLGIVTPILVQRARTDIAEAVEEMHEGVEKALQEYADNMAAEVWRRMEPVVRLVHVMKGKVESIVGRASNEE